MKVYALTSSQSPRETLEFFLRRKAAEAELCEILKDEPDWKDVLRVVPIELDDGDVSANEPTHPASAVPLLIGLAERRRGTKPLGGAAANMPSRQS